jgi:uncharacterized cupredoxin-like copper-binding protein
MKPTPILFAAALAAASLSASAHEAAHERGSAPAHAHPGVAAREQTDWGIGGDPKAARRTIRVGMSDAMRFTPSMIEVGEGETVKFEIRNEGQVLHEMVIGTKKELEEHAALMRKFPGMEHEDAWMAHVAPGHTGEIAWTFNRPGTFQFACLVAGHYEAGMTGEIRVLPRHAHGH